MSITLVSIMNIWIMIATIGMGLIFYRIRCIYVCTARCLRRLEALSRSTLMSHTNATISGLSTIRVTNSKDVLVTELGELQDHNTSIWFIFKGATQAIAFWLDLICVLYMATAVGIFLIYEERKELPKMLTFGFKAQIHLCFSFRIHWWKRGTSDNSNPELDISQSIECSADSGLGKSDDFS